MWGAIALATIGEICAYRALGLSLDLSNSAIAIAFIVGTIGLAALQHRMSDDGLRTAAMLVESFGLLSMVSMLGGLASYAVVAGNSGFTDNALAAADHAMGFDWRAHYAFVAQHPTLAKIANFAYSGIFLSPSILLFSLVLSGRAAQATRFLLAFAIALATTIFIFHFFPARSALAHHIGMHPEFMPSSGLDHIAIIDRLRDGTLTRINPTAIAGIITFPSFHAASALLFIWAAWPVRWLRLPMLAMNLAMLAATPVEGTHYLIDVIGGLAVAAGAIASLGLPASIRGGLRYRTAMPPQAASA